MNIGIDGSRYGDKLATGVEWYSFHIINALLEELKGGNDEVTVYSREKLPLSGVENKVLHAKRLWTLSALTREMRSHPPEVLFVPSHVLPLSLPERSVITIHDVAFHHMKKVYSFKDYHYLNWSTRFAVKRAGALIVPSEATKKDLVKFFNCDEAKITVIPHGFTIDDAPQAEIDKVMKESIVFEYFGITKETPYVLFVGRLESKKNLVNLVEAFAKFAEEFPEYRLVLAGKRGIGFHEITRVVAKLKIADKVVMPGYVTETEKQALMKYCEIFAFPSLYEGFGFPVLEAFHFKKPVLTSDLSSLPEVGGDAVHYADPYSVYEIAEGLYKLVTDGRYVDKLVKSGTERLKKFSWGKAAKATLKVLHGQ